MTEDERSDSGDLHARIVNMRVQPRDEFVQGDEDLGLAWKMGARDARHAAAEIVSACEADVAGLLDALEDLLTAYPDGDGLRQWVPEENSMEDCAIQEARQRARALIAQHRGES